MNTFEDNRDNIMEDEVFSIMGAAGFISSRGAKAFLKRLQELYPKEYAQLIMGVGGLATTKPDVGKLLKS